MNAASAAPTQGFGSTARLIGGVIILILAGVALYYLYDYMFNVTSIQTKAAIVSGPIAATTATFQYPKSDDADTKLTQYIFQGGETSISFWMYVTGSGSDSTTKKHILHLGTNADGTDIPTLLVALGGTTNGLFVQVDDGATSGVTTAGIYAYMMASGNNDTTAKCNIANIEYGRWVNVTIVLNNTLCDVYMDGKLARSSVLRNQFQVKGNSTTPLYFYLLKSSFPAAAGATVNTAWKGSISNVNFYNYAVSPDEVYRLYMAGPSGSGGNLWDYIKSFFGTTNITKPVVS
jgi:Concanavalin A-like lectin/glucanases superfamily